MVQFTLLTHSYSSSATLKTLPQAFTFSSPYHTMYYNAMCQTIHLSHYQGGSWDLSQCRTDKWPFAAAPVQVFTHHADLSHTSIINFNCVRQCGWVPGISRIRSQPMRSPFSQAADIIVDASHVYRTISQQWWNTTHPSSQHTHTRTSFLQPRLFHHSLQPL